MDSPIGEWCRYCDPKNGCRIHAIKPRECRIYECAWLKMDKVNPALRPDRSRIIWDAINDHIMFGVHDPRCKMKKIVVNQINEFVKNGSSVVIHVLGSKPQIALAEGYTYEVVWEEVLEKYKEYLNDST
jgi:hypothetical protein